jgi:rubrerythrin
MTELLMRALETVESIAGCIFDVVAGPYEDTHECAACGEQGTNPDQCPVCGWPRE